MSFARLSLAELPVAPLPVVAVDFSPTCDETFNWHSFLNPTAEITEEPIVMLSTNNIEGRGEKKHILYGDLFANYSILRVDTV